MSKEMFYIHPRYSLKDLTVAGYECREVPEEELEKSCPNMSPWLGDTTNDQKELIGWLGVLPLKGSQIITDDMALQREYKKRALEKMFLAIRMALDKCKGEHLVVGLGSLTAPISNQGLDIIKEFSGYPMSVTTGNSLTAYVTYKSVEKIAKMRGLDLENETVAVLGSTGSVGGAVSELLARRSGKLIISARNEARLKILKDRIVQSNAKDCDKVQISTSVEDLRQAKVIVVTTSSSQVLIKPEHCSENAIIYDDTMPRNTSEEILTKRPDVLVVDGGIVATPFVDFGGFSIGLPPGKSYACLTETLMLAKEDIKENFIGNVSLEQVEQVGKIFENHQHEYFIAPFTSFGKELL